MLYRRKTVGTRLMALAKLLLCLLALAVPFYGGVYGYKYITSSKEGSVQSQQPAEATAKPVNEKQLPVVSCAYAAQAAPKQVDAAGTLDQKGTWIKIVKHEHKLYIMKNKEIIKSYGIAVGKNTGQKERNGDCKTPEGVFSVQSVHDAKSWVHDFKDGKGAVKDAYGPWFIRLKTGWNGIGIHGTHDPDSIGNNVTEGCIRLHNNDLTELKTKYIKNGLRVVIEN